MRSDHTSMFSLKEYGDAFEPELDDQGALLEAYENYKRQWRPRLLPAGALRLLQQCLDEEALRPDECRVADILVHQGYLDRLSVGYRVTAKGHAVLRQQ